jgi:AhpD family alkylhydroperoxidase
LTDLSPAATQLRCHTKFCVKAHNRKARKLGLN